MQGSACGQGSMFFLLAAFRTEATYLYVAISPTGKNDAVERAAWGGAGLTRSRGLPFPLHPLSDQPADMVDAQPRFSAQLRLRHATSSPLSREVKNS